MTDAPPDTGTEEAPDTPDTDAEETSEESDAWTPPDKAAWDKLTDKATRREAKLREAQAELAKLRGEKEAPAEPSEADKLRTGMIRTEGRAVLAGIGVTDRADQAAILDAIRLDGIEVDDSGEVDADELESRISTLRRILSVPAQSKPRPRLDPKDKGGRDATPADRDKARRLRFLTGGQ